MTETAEDSVDQFYDAARLCGFDRQGGWPERIEVHHLVLLMAGGGPGRKPDEWKRANAQVNDGIEAGTLKTEDVDQGFEEVEHDAANLTDAERFRKAVFPKHDSFTGRTQYVWYERRKKKPKRYITREACRDWLHTIRKTPPCLVRAWLGPVWQEEAPKVGAGDTAPAEKRAMVSLKAAVDALRSNGHIKAEAVDPATGEIRLLAAAFSSSRLLTGRAASMDSKLRSTMSCGFSTAPVARALPGKCHCRSMPSCWQSPLNTAPVLADPASQ